MYVSSVARAAASACNSVGEHFQSFAGRFRSKTRNIAVQAEKYLHGLYQSPRANMERMSEMVAQSEYHSLHHMLSDAVWDFAGVRQDAARQANELLGGAAAGLLLDESGFEKKGDASAGVARQYNGRLGKVENSQVGVFAALAHGTLAAIIDFELFLPRHWVADAARCEKAGIPESARVFRSKPEIAAEMVKRARAAGVCFGFIGADGLYGNATWLLFVWDAAGEVFATEVHIDQQFYFANPRLALVPAWQAREWAARLKPSAWRTVVLRDGEKGEVRAEFASTRVWITHPDSDQAHQWHLLARRDGKQVKFMLSNAAPESSLAELARMQAQRHFIERAFEDAKGCCGMADYQVRKWRAWHNHMALVCVALLFLVKERQKHAPFATLLSCADVVDMLVAQLPVKIRGREDAVQTIVERHKRRQRARDSAYRRQAPSTEECH